MSVKIDEEAQKFGQILQKYREQAKSSVNRKVLFRKLPFSRPFGTCIAVLSSD